MKNEPNRCDAHETQVSAWLDDQLERTEQIELLDHLVRCPACRQFYRSARALDGLAEAVHGAATAAPVGVWERISGEVGAAERPRRRRVPPWALRAAALLLLATGLVFVFRPSTPSAPSDTLDIMLAEDGGTMTEERFVELTAEVLRSDPRYHQAMYQVMDQVLRDSRGREGSVDRSPVGGEYDDEGEEGSFLFPAVRIRS